MIADKVTVTITTTTPVIIKLNQSPPGHPCNNKPSTAPAPDFSLVHSNYARITSVR